MLEGLRRLKQDLDSIGSLPNALETADFERFSYRLRMSLLLNIAMTKRGSNTLHTNGLLTIIESSTYLRADPEFGFTFLAAGRSEVDPKEYALQFYLDLLLPILRLIACVLLNLAQNEGFIDHVRRLLVRLQNVILFICRAQASVTPSTPPGIAKGLGEAMDLFVILAKESKYHEAALR